MINIHLYNRLKSRFGLEIFVKSENELPVYVEKKEEVSSFLKRPAKSDVSLSYWGETFQFSCPYCDDERDRFFVSGFAGSRLQVKDNAVKVRDRVYSCKNEGCQSTFAAQKEMDKIISDSQVAKLLHPDEECVDSFIKKNAGDVEGNSCLTINNRNIKLPDGLLPISSKNIPDYVRDYICDRGFSAHELSTVFGIKICTPKSRVTGIDGKHGYSFGYYAMLIPLISRRLCLGWQARLIPYVKGKLLTPAEERVYLKECSKDPKRRFIKKYNFAKGIEKNKGFYNMDTALYSKNIVLCEGVTDAWKLGKNAIASYGKTLSQAQIEIMKLMWGWGATSLVIAYDSDVDCSSLITQIRALDIFKLGVARMKLPEGKDPGDMSSKDLKVLVTEAESRLE